MQHRCRNSRLGDLSYGLLRAVCSPRTKETTSVLFGNSLQKTVISGKTGLFNLLVFDDDDSAVGKVFSIDGAIRCPSVLAARHSTKIYIVTLAIEAHAFDEFSAGFVHENHSYGGIFGHGPTRVVGFRLEFYAEIAGQPRFGLDFESVTLIVRGQKLHVALNQLIERAMLVMLEVIALCNLHQ